MAIRNQETGSGNQRVNGGAACCPFDQRPHHQCKRSVMATLIVRHAAAPPNPRRQKADSPEMAEAAATAGTPYMTRTMYGVAAILRDQLVKGRIHRASLFHHLG